MKDKLEEEILGLCSDIASYVKENKECEKLYDSIIAKYEKLLKQKDQEMQREVSVEIKDLQLFFDDKLVRVFDPKDAEYKNVRLTGAEAHNLATAIHNLIYGDKQ